VRVLLDENLPHALRKSLVDHQTETAVHAGLAGYKNGDLLRAATEAGFDVLVTGDKTLRYEQNLAGKLALITLSANSWNIIKNHVGKIAAAIAAAEPATLTIIEFGPFRRVRKPKGPAPA
jgi:hypothetical protein